MNRTRSLFVVLVQSLVVMLAAACPGDPEPVSGKCTRDQDCAYGSFCSVDGSCAEGPRPPSGQIDTFTLDTDSIRPDETVRVAWTTVDVVSCTLQVDAASPQSVEPNGEQTLSLPNPGEHLIALVCVDANARELGQERTVRVREVRAGDLVLASQDDVLRNVSVEEVEGDVIVSAVTLTSVSDLQLRVVGGSVRFQEVEGMRDLTLTNLERVGGELTFSSLHGLENLLLPNVVSVGETPASDGAADFIVKDCEDLVMLYVPRLATVGRNISLGTIDLPNLPSTAGGTPAPLPLLAALKAPLLKTVGGYFEVRGAAQLEDLSFPVLKTVGGTVVLAGNRRALIIAMPKLERAGSVIIDGSGLSSLEPELHIDLRRLQTLDAIEDDQSRIAAELYANGSAVPGFRAGDLLLVANSRDAGVADAEDNSAIVELNLTRLQTVAGRLDVVGTSLEGLDLPALETIDGLRVRSNALLEGAVALPALVRVGPSGLELSGNDILIGLTLLEAVDGDTLLTPRTMPSLSSLASVGGVLDLGDLTQAELVHFPALAQVGTLRLDRSLGGVITNVSLPALTTATTIELRGGGITDVAFCALTSVETLTIEDTSIDTLDGLRALTQVTTLDIRGQTALAECLVEALAAQTSPTNNTSEANTGAAPGSCSIGSGVCG